MSSLEQSIDPKVAPGGISLSSGEIAVTKFLAESRLLKNLIEKAKDLPDYAKEYISYFINNFDKLSPSEYKSIQDFIVEISIINLENPNYLLVKWDKDSDSLEYLGKKINLPTPLDLICRSLVDLKLIDEDQLSYVKEKFSRNYGFWNIFGQIKDVSVTDDKLNLVITSKDDSSLTIPIRKTIFDFLEHNLSKMEKLTERQRKAIIENLSNNKRDLLKIRSEQTEIISLETNPDVAIYLEIAETTTINGVDLGIQATYLTIHISSDDFLDKYFEETIVNLKKQDPCIIMRLHDFIKINQGPWNQRGYVESFFVDDTGTIKCKTISGGVVTVNLPYSYEEFYEIFLESDDSKDKSALYLARLGLIDLKREDFPEVNFVRGTVKSVERVSPNLLLIRGHDNSILDCIGRVYNFGQLEKIVDENKSLSEDAKLRIIDEISRSRLTVIENRPHYKFIDFITDIFEDKENKKIIITFIDGEIQFLDY
jgi:hypothetical protein